MKKMKKEKKEKKEKNKIYICISKGTRKKNLLAGMKCPR